MVGGGTRPTLFILVFSLACLCMPVLSVFSMLSVLSVFSIAYSALLLLYVSSLLLFAFVWLRVRAEHAEPLGIVGNWDRTG